MAGTKDIKKRIRSVKNIAQITKAMEVVSMNKMRRSQQFALAARPYALASLDMLKNILTRTSRKNIPQVLRPRPIHRAVLVVITADKGLVGGFNESILRLAEKWIREKKNQNIDFSIITIGKKARDYFERKNISLYKSFTDFGDYTSFKDTEPIAHLILSDFEKARFDSVDIIYTHFKTTLRQEQKMTTLLPSTEKSLEEIIQEIIPEYGLHSELRNQQYDHTKYNYTYSFEPNPEKIITDLVHSILKIAFHHVMLESNASEHSARMITMKNASDNADDIQHRLTLEMNKVRQASITSEISEIIAGAEALQ